MEKTIISKMRIKPDTKIILRIKNEAAKKAIMQDKTVSFVSTKIADAVIVEVASLVEFKKLFPEAIKMWNDNSSLWFLYPKSNNKVSYDINRDILWQEVRSLGFDLVANIAINQEFSSVRVKRV